MTKVILLELKLAKLDKFNWNLWIHDHHHLNFSPVLLLKEFWLLLHPFPKQSWCPQTQHCVTCLLWAHLISPEEKPLAFLAFLKKEEDLCPLFFWTYGLPKILFSYASRGSDSSFGKPATLSILRVKEQITKHPKCTCPTELSLVQLIWHLIK